MYNPWYEEIQKTLISHQELQTRVSTCISELITDLKSITQPVRCEFSEGAEMSWQIKIGYKTITITENEIESESTKYGGDLKEVLQRLITLKFVAK